MDDKDRQMPTKTLNTDLDVHYAIEHLRLQGGHRRLSDALREWLEKNAPDALKAGKKRADFELGWEPGSDESE